MNPNKKHIAEILDPVAQRIELLFVGGQKEELDEVLSFFLFNNISELLSTAVDFLAKEVDLESLTPDKFETIDLKGMTLRFIQRFNSNSIGNLDEIDLEKFNSVLIKLGRICIHETLVPTLLSIDSDLANKVVNQVSRIMGDISIIEGLPRDFGVTLLRLDEVEIPERPIGFDLPPIQEEENDKVRGEMVEKLRDYFIWNLPKTISVKLADILKDDYDIIGDKNRFVSMLNSKGELYSLVPVNANRNKLIVFVLLIQKLFSLTTNNCDGGDNIISLSCGKGFWKLLRKSVKCSESGDDLQDLSKLWSEANINKDGKYDVNHSQANEIVNQLLK